MARQKKKSDEVGENVVDYRHKAVKRLNIPPAGLTARGHIVREKKVRYAYNPHLTPVLRFDVTGKGDSMDSRTIGFGALINIRPDQENRGMEIENRELRKRIEEIVRRLLEIET
jgi:hypothetical protein